MSTKCKKCGSWYDPNADEPHVCKSKRTPKKLAAVGGDGTIIPGNSEELSAPERTRSLVVGRKVKGKRKWKFVCKRENKDGTVCDREFKSDHGLSLHEALTHDRKRKKKKAKVTRAYAPRQHKREQIVRFCPGCGLNLEAVAMSIRVQT